MKCPDCGRPMDESMDKKHQYFTCPRCGFEVHRSSWDAMDRYWLKEKCNKYTNLIIWEKLKELKKEKRISTKKMKDKKEEVNKLEVDFGDTIANLKLLSQNFLKGIDAMGEGSIQKEAEKTNAELLVETFKSIAIKYSEEDIDNAVALLKQENENFHKILKGEK